jgi:MinD superfamily P-loop ATPase
MSIKDRIRRLETENAKHCQECRDIPPPRIHVVYPGEVEPDPEYCPGCGRSLGVVIRVVYEDSKGRGIAID